MRVVLWLFKAYWQLGPDGVTEEIVRLCVGIEHIDDLLDNLDQALAA